MDCIMQTLNSNPPWFRNSVTYTSESLTVLKHVELRSVAFSASRRHDIRVVKNDKHSFDVIVHDYRSECLTITALTNEYICVCFRKYLPPFQNVYYICCTVGFRSICHHVTFFICPTNLQNPLKSRKN